MDDVHREALSFVKVADVHSGESVECIAGYDRGFSKEELLAAFNLLDEERPGHSNVRVDTLWDGCAIFWDMPEEAK